MACLPVSHTGLVPFSAKIFLVFIASPSDLQQERAVATQAIESWNRSHARAEQTAFVPVRWEWAVAAQGSDGQSQINTQQVESADVVLAMFKDKLGKPTKKHPSGTAEEIAVGLSLNKVVSVLRFSVEGDDSISRDQAEEISRLNEYLSNVFDDGLVQKFGTDEELHRRIEDLLWKVVRDNRTAPLVVAPNETLDAVRDTAHSPSAVDWIRLPENDNWSPAGEGRVAFDYRSYNGAYYFGFADNMFLTQWSEASDGSIWAYGEADSSIEGVAVIQGFLETLGNQAKAMDADSLNHVRLDFTSTRQRAREGDLLIFKKSSNLVLLVLVEKVRAVRPVDVVCNYRIAQWDSLPEISRLR